MEPIVLVDLGLCVANAGPNPLTPAFRSELAWRPRSRECKGCAPEVGGVWRDPGRGGENTEATPPKAATVLPATPQPDQLRRGR